MTLIERILFYSLFLTDIVFVLLLFVKMGLRPSCLMLYARLRWIKPADFNFFNVFSKLFKLAARDFFYRCQKKLKNNIVFALPFGGVDQIDPIAPIVIISVLGVILYIIENRKYFRRLANLFKMYLKTFYLLRKWTTAPVKLFYVKTKSVIFKKKFQKALRKSILVWELNELINLLDEIGLKAGELYFILFLMPMFVCCFLLPGVVGLCFYNLDQIAFVCKENIKIVVFFLFLLWVGGQYSLSYMLSFYKKKLNEIDNFADAVKKYSEGVKSFEEAIKKEFLKNSLENGTLNVTTDWSFITKDFKKVCAFKELADTTLRVINVIKCLKK